MPRPRPGRPGAAARRFPDKQAGELPCRTALRRCIVCSMPGGIGTKNESSLHRVLKYQYAGEAGGTERAVGEYVCDGITAGGVYIEIQTGSFGPLKEKIPVLAACGPVRIIHPIFAAKYIETFDESGNLLRRRKSGRRGTAWDLFSALLYAPELPLVPNVSVEIVMVDVAEKRVTDGRGSWRRGGMSIVDREILAHHETIPIRRLKDYLFFVPFTAREAFTVRDLAGRADITETTARKCLYVLARLGLVQRTGKTGRWITYRKTALRPTAPDGGIPTKSGAKAKSGGAKTGGARAKKAARGC